jgi:dolichyl-phosphate-mannose-protein mannosyltransferase
MGKTLPYWLDEKSNAQVTLLGNPLLWWMSTASIHVFLVVTTLYLLRQRRQYWDIDTGQWLERRLLDQKMRICTCA